MYRNVHVPPPTGAEPTPSRAHPIITLSRLPLAALAPRMNERMKFNAQGMVHNQRELEWRPGTGTWEACAGKRAATGLLQRAGGCTGADKASPIHREIDRKVEAGWRVLVRKKEVSAAALCWSRGHPSRRRLILLPVSLALGLRVHMRMPCELEFVDLFAETKRFLDTHFREELYHNPRQARLWSKAARRYCRRILSSDHGPTCPPNLSTQP